MKQAELIRTLNAIDDINAMARQARRLCTDIVRQTSLTPYYGKRGAAAVYAANDESEAQREAIQTATRLLSAVNELLVDIAINGGTTEAKVKEILLRDGIGGYIFYGDNQI